MSRFSRTGVRNRHARPGTGITVWCAGIFSGLVIGPQERMYATTRVSVDGRRTSGGTDSEGVGAGQSSAKVAFEVTKAEEEWQKSSLPPSSRSFASTPPKGGIEPTDKSTARAPSTAPAATLRCTRPRPSSTVAPAAELLGPCAGRDGTSGTELLRGPTEVHCRRCGGHLGHVFDDGPRPTASVTASMVGRWCSNRQRGDLVNVAGSRDPAPQRLSEVSRSLRRKNVGRGLPPEAARPRRQEPFQCSRLCGRGVERGLRRLSPAEHLWQLLHVDVEHRRDVEGQLCDTRSPPTTASPMAAAPRPAPHPARLAACPSARPSSSS